MMTKKANEKKKDDARGFNPFVDWSFKRIFASEQNKDLMIGFLNLLLEEEEKVADLQYLNTESLPDDVQNRGCFFDVLCTDAYGNKFLVEMQNSAIPYMENRIVYYSCRLIDQMGEKGEKWKYDIKKAYSICLMNFTYGAEERDVRQDIKLCDISDGSAFSDKIHIILLQIPRLRWRTIGQCRKYYEMLLLLLNEINNNMSTIAELKAEVDATPMPEDVRELFKKMLDVTNVESLTGIDKIKYERDLKHYRDYMSCIDYAREEGKEEGKKEGKEEGKKEGKEEGKKEGKEEGKAEEQRRIAKSLKSDGIPIAIIAKNTGLSEEEVEKL